MPERDLQRFSGKLQVCPICGGEEVCDFFYRHGGNMDEYLTIFEVAEMTKYTVGTLRKFVLKRRIAFHKWGRVLRFKRREIELWIKSGAREAVYLPDEGGGKPETAGNESVISLGGEAGK